MAIELTMKKALMYSCAVAMTFVLGACGSSKKATGEPNPYGAELTLTECEAYAQQMPGKRAAGKGVSFDESTARQLAETDARATFSRALEEAIMSASKRSSFDITQYSGSDTEGGSSTDGGMKNKSLVKTVSSNVISDAHIVKTNKFYGKNRQYTVFVCLEYGGTTKDLAAKVTKEIKQRVSDSDRAKIDGEIAKFEKEVEKELDSKK